MNKNKSFQFILAILLIGFAGLVYFNSGAINQVPDISISTINGEEIATTSLNGKPALITFWATDCPS